MAILVEFSVPTDAFPLGRVFETLPEATIELERIVPTRGALCPYVWIRGATPEAVERALGEAQLEGEPLRSFTLVDELEGRESLYRAEWGDGLEGIVTAIVDSPVTLLAGSCRDGVWTFQVRADDHDDVVAFRESCLEHGVSISLSKLQPLSSGPGYDDGVTAPQLEALGLAFERGYFDDPRRVTLDDLSAELGITRQSVAGRLRRGHRNVLANVFAARQRSVALND